MQQANKHIKQHAITKTKLKLKQQKQNAVNRSAFCQQENTR